MGKFIVTFEVDFAVEAENEEAALEAADQAFHLWELCAIGSEMPVHVEATKIYDADGY